MSVFKFLLPVARESKIKWFEKQYDEEIKDKDVDLDRKSDERPSVVAHSFGTYIVGWALFKYEELKVNKVILCGSILPTDFPWDTLLERGQVRTVRNEFGVSDIWVKWVRFFVAKTGPSGSKGFTRTHPRLEQKQFEFRHSDYFREGHMRAFWMPFLNRRESTVMEKQLTGKKPAWFPPVGLYVIVFSLAVALAAVFVHFANNQVALRNSSAEETPSGIGWTRAWWKANDHFEIASDKGRNGSRSFKISTTEPNHLRWVQRLQLEPNAKYMLTAWIRTEDVAHSKDEMFDLGANLAVQFMSPQQDPIYSEPVFGTHDWQQVAVRFSTTNSADVEVQLQLGAYSSATTGTAWFDDVELRRVRIRLPITFR
jgi:pimeloyl-ACP methyl ester carboxylesterase